jgi:hypothetical protein
MPVLEHIHTYVFMKKTARGRIYYKCDDPLCSHFIERDRIIGKMSLCSKCRNKEILLTYKDQFNVRKNPLCIECQQTKDALDFRENKSLMDTLLKGQEG